MKHKHHKIPKHAGGNNHSSNIVELTVEEHAEAHRKLFEQYGRWQDYVAWKGLEGSIGKEELKRLKTSLANKGRKVSAETRSKMSEKNAGQNNPMFGKKQSASSNEKNRQSQIRNGNKPPNRKGIKQSSDHIVKRTNARLANTVAVTAISDRMKEDNPAKRAEVREKLRQRKLEYWRRKNDKKFDGSVIVVDHDNDERIKP